MLDDVGDPDASPGSPAWSRWFVLRAKKYRADLRSDAKTLTELLGKLETHRAWQALKYASFGMFCEIEIGLTGEEIDRFRAARPGQTVGDVVLKKHGRPPKEEGKKCTNGTFSPPERGQTVPYLTARIVRDFPEIAARLDAGEFPSVRRAAMEAGIVGPSFQCPNDPVKASRRLLRHFSGDTLLALLGELANHAGYDLVPRQ